MDFHGLSESEKIIHENMFVLFYLTGFLLSLAGQPAFAWFEIVARRT